MDALPQEPFLDQNNAPRLKCKILVVDDDAFNIFTLENLLEKLEIPSDSAFNGENAIEMIEENIEEYGMILMDYNMPIIGGIEVILTTIYK